MKKERGSMTEHFTNPAAVRGMRSRFAWQASAFSYLLVLLAAGFWATLGIFYKTLISTYGLPPLAIVFWRALIAAIALFLFLFTSRKDLLHIPRRDWPFFLFFGLIGVAAFYTIYVNAVALTGMGVAAVLMYTAPVWVTLLSVLFLGERLDGRKILALSLAVAGGALVGRVYDLDGVRLNQIGLLAGIGAGLGYGLYILFSKAAAQRRYNPWTTLAYALGLGALFLLPLQSAADLTRVLTNPPILVWLFGIGLLPTLGGGLAFNAALQRLPASNASIVATLEPVIATVLGWAIFAERLDALQILGGALIGSAVILLQLRTNNSLGRDHG
jgi:drug/metabolite transporter (DMT)-like permease